MTDVLAGTSSASSLGSAYASFTTPHEEAIPTGALAADYDHLVATARAHPGVKYFVRYRHDGQDRYGKLDGSSVQELTTHFFDSPQPTGKTIPLREVRLLAPLDPNRVSKVLGVAFNTVNPDVTSLPSESHPRWFAKLPTSITGPGGGIEVPEESTQFIHEAELVLVMGRQGRHIPVEDALSFVWGVTAGNDFTEADWMGETKGRQSPSRLMAKGVDTFAAIGPAIAVGLDYSPGLQITHRINGQVTQSGMSTARLQSPAELVSHVSRFVTLLPGDLIYTGAAPFIKDTPYRVVEPGHELEAEVDGIGILRNRAVKMGGVPWEARKGD